MDVVEGTRPRPLRWRPRTVDKLVSPVEKRVGRLRYRKWFIGCELTSDWTSGNYTRWSRILGPWRDRPLRILEIGSWEGRSAIFFLNFFPKSKVTCVDAFAEFPEIEGRFDRNTANFKQRVEKIKASSVAGLERLRSEGRTFDLIYIDADHSYAAVKGDSLGAWLLSEPGAVIIWDDYRWHRKQPRGTRAMDAVDEFLHARAGSYRLLCCAYQLAIERL